MCCKKIFLAVIRFFLVGAILALRPLLGPAVCRFQEGCTAYACRQLEQKSFFKAFRNIIARLISCRPFTS